MLTLYISSYIFIMHRYIYTHTHILSVSVCVYFLLQLVFKQTKLKRNIRRMSGRRSRQSSGISDDQIIKLVSKLHQLLPQIHNSSRSNKASASKVLQETCNYIKSLQKEMDDLSARLSELLSTFDDDSPQAAVIRALI